MSLWNSLERRSATLFLLASLILLVAASHRGLAYLLESFAFNPWIGDLASLLGRLAVLLGLGGLSVAVANRNPRLGKLSRAVVSVAVIFVIVLLTLALLENAGVTTALVAVFGLGTFALSVISYLLFGAVILRTGAHSTLVGVLLLAATVALLTVFVGQMVLPVDLIGTVVEGALFVFYLAIGYRLRAEPAPTDRTEPAPTDRTEPAPAEVQHD